MFGFSNNEKLVKSEKKLKLMKKRTRTELSNINQRLIEIMDIGKQKGNFPMTLLRYVKKDVGKLHASLK